MGQLSPLRRTVAADTTATVRPASPAAPASAPALRPLTRDAVVVTAASARPRSLDVRALEDRIARETGTPVTQGNRMELHVDGKEAWPRFMATLQSAQKTLHLQKYIFGNDTTSWNVAEALAERAAHGVKVRVSTDYIGSPTSDPIFEFLRANGVEVRHHVTSGWNSQVDHRKIVVVDGKTAMTGGMNVKNEYEHEWHDAMVTIQGPAVHEIQREFLDGWHDHGGSEVAPDETVFSPEALRPAGRASMQVVTTYPQPNFERSLHAAIDSAQKNVNLEMPYFSDQALVDRLVAAARRGVTVNLVLPGQSDVGLMDAAAKAHFDRLRAAGANIYLYQGRILHAKVVTVDGVWATIGSGNGDARSLRLHREMNVNVGDPETVATIDRRIFAADVAASKPYVLQKPGLARRALNAVLRFVSPVL